MNIEVKDIVTLSNNSKYCVISTISYNNINYLYLINIDNKNDVKFVYYENNRLNVVKDNSITDKIIPLFLKINE